MRNRVGAAREGLLRDVLRHGSEVRLVVQDRAHHRVAQRRRVRIQGDPDRFVHAALVPGFAQVNRASGRVRAAPARGDARLVEAVGARHRLVVPQRNHVVHADEVQRPYTDPTGPLARRLADHQPVGFAAALAERVDQIA